MDRLRAVLARSAWSVLAGSIILVGLRVTPTGATQATTFNDAEKDGLRAWRKPGKIGHAACADCHGPDGLELAIYNFDDADLRRRAAPHLNENDLERVVGLVHAVRARYRITKMLDPLEDRPFQTGGGVLPGATAAARDLAFGRELEIRLPHLMNGRIAGIDQAKAAAAELMAVDPWKLKIGLPFSRFSEDAFHGKEHASLAHWVPDVARVVPEPNRAKWYALQDAYLANPTEAALWRLYEGFDLLTKPASGDAIAEIAGEKYRSLLLLQHSARRAHQEGKARNPVAFGARTSPLVPSPMWGVGDIARRFQDGTPESMGLDPDLARKKSGGPSFRRQMVEMTASWLWLGWLFDQGLHRTSARPMIARGDWLAAALQSAGPYPIHNMYWLARKQLVTNRIPEAWLPPPGRRQPEWNFKALRIGSGFDEAIPSDPVHRALYERFATNCYRMSLYLMLDEWRRTRMVWFRHAATEDVYGMTNFIAIHDPAWAPQLRALRQALYDAIDTCKEKT